MSRPIWRCDPRPNRRAVVRASDLRPGCFTPRARQRSTASDEPPISRASVRVSGNVSRGTSESGWASSGSADIQRIPIAHIRPNPFQPRKEFKTEELVELAASLEASGLLQPVTIRRVQNGGEDRYELLVGERRLRAAAHLGWADIPALIRDVDDRTALTLALVENLQRSDLNPIEEAVGYAQLMEQFSLTQQQVAQAVGKERSTVANMLRLLNLPAGVQMMVRDGRLSLGHARALLMLGSEREILAAA